MIFLGITNVIYVLIGVVIGQQLAGSLLKNNRMYANRSALDRFHHSEIEAEDYTDNVESIDFHNGNNTHHKLDNTVVADAIAKKVRIFCWILTVGRRHAKSATHAKNTWVKRCDNRVFMSSEDDPILPAINLNISEKNNWGKTKAAFKYIYDRHIDSYDWFLKADDDTYVIMENLRFMLLPFNADDPFYFGARFKRGTYGYMTGGPGYILSREAVKRFVVEALPDPELCTAIPKGDAESSLAKCLSNVGVYFEDTRDHEGQHRFLPMSPHDHLSTLHERKTDSLKRQMFYPIEHGTKCCSDRAISFHFVKGKMMYMMEYFMYHLKTFGLYRPIRLNKNDSILHAAKKASKKYTMK